MTKDFYGGKRWMVLLALAGIIAPHAIPDFLIFGPFPGARAHLPHRGGIYILVSMSLLYGSIGLFSGIMLDKVLKRWNI